MENIFPKNRSVLTKKKTPPKHHPSQACLLERDIIGAASSPICFWRCNDQNSRACEGRKLQAKYMTQTWTPRGFLYDLPAKMARRYFSAHQTLVANAWLLPSQGTNISHLWKRNIIFKSDFFGGYVSFPAKVTNFWVRTISLCTRGKKNITERSACNFHSGGTLQWSGFHFRSHLGIVIGAIIWRQAIVTKPDREWANIKNMSIRNL